MQRRPNEIWLIRHCNFQKLVHCFVFIFYFCHWKHTVCIDFYYSCCCCCWWWFTLWSVLTSVPYLARAALACWRIFSLYIWAARLLYLALVSLVEQPCWRKKAVLNAEGDNMLFIHSPASPSLVLQHKYNHLKRKSFFPWVYRLNFIIVFFLAVMSIQTYSIGIASDLHTSELKPVPVGVQLSGSAAESQILSSGVWWAVSSTKILRHADCLCVANERRLRTWWSWDALPASGGCLSSRCTGTRRRRCWPS